jgi:hypothetical protein
MTVQSIIDEVKAVLRTEGLPLTNQEIAQMVGRVAQTLSTQVPLIPVRDYIFTTKQGEYSLPSDYTLIERVVYKPSASATVASRDTTNNRLTVSENLRERGWAENGMLLNKSNGVKQRYRLLSNNILAVQNASQFWVGDVIEEDVEAIELPVQAITAPNDEVRGVAGDTAPYAVGVYGRWLRLSPDKKIGHENLIIYAYIAHPPVFMLSDAIVLPPYTASYLIYETAFRLLLQFAGEEAPPLVQALKSRANEELQTLMNKSATVQSPPAITVYRRRGVRQYE